MTLPGLLAVLTLLVALPLNVIVTVNLWNLSRQSPGIRVLRERAVVATALTVIVAVFAAVFVQNDQPQPPLDGDLTKFITRVTVLVMSIVPAAYWWTLYRSHKP